MLRFDSNLLQLSPFPRSTMLYWDMKIKFFLKKIATDDLIKE